MPADPDRPSDPDRPADRPTGATTTWSAPARAGRDVRAEPSAGPLTPPLPVVVVDRPVVRRPGAALGGPPGRWAPPPGPAPLVVVLGTVGLAVLAAATLTSARPGVDLPVLAGGLVALIVRAGRRPGTDVTPEDGRGRSATADRPEPGARPDALPVADRPTVADRPDALSEPSGTVGRTVADRPGAFEALLLVLAVALAAVAALRDSPWLVLLCGVAAVGLAAVAAGRPRTWAGLFGAVTRVARAWLPAITWFGAAVGGLPRPSGSGSWVRGGVLGGLLCLVFGGLLAWADPVFAVSLGRLWPDLQLTDLPGQVVVGVVTALLATGLTFTAAAPVPWVRARVARCRPGAEWALPLALVDAVLLAFGSVQAAVLFGGYTPSLAAAGVTYADRAREGFGQLVVVTVLTAVLLGWAARCAEPSPAGRRLLALTGGPLVLLSLGVVASALRRMWLYEHAYGWTVLRLCVATAELWLGGVLVVVAVVWAVHRTAWLPRVVLVTAAGVLLGLAVAGPDAVVARWNVDLYRETGRIDPDYLSGLSADAVPALACLREPGRSQVLGGRTVGADPWYAANLARTRAVDALSRPASAGGC